MSEKKDHISPSSATSYVLLPLSARQFFQILDQSTMSVLCASAAMVSALWFSIIEIVMAIQL